MPAECLYLMLSSENPADSTERNARPSGVCITVRPMVVEDMEQVVALDQMSFSPPMACPFFSL